MDNDFDSFDFDTDNDFDTVDNTVDTYNADIDDFNEDEDDIGDLAEFYGGANLEEMTAEEIDAWLERQRRLSDIETAATMMFLTRDEVLYDEHGNKRPREQLKRIAKGQMELRKATKIRRSFFQRFKDNPIGWTVGLSLLAFCLFVWTSPMYMTAEQFSKFMNTSIEFLATNPITVTIGLIATAALIISTHEPAETPDKTMEIRDEKGNRLHVAIKDHNRKHDMARIQHLEDKIDRLEKRDQ